MPAEVGRERAIAGDRTVRDDVQEVEEEQLRDVGLVGLNLVVRGLDVGVDVCRVLQLDHHQRKAVDEENDVGAANLLPVDGELLHGEEIVGAVEVDDAHPQNGPSPIVLDSLDGHAIAQPVVHLLVAVHHRLRAVPSDERDSLLELLLAESRVQFRDGIAQARHQHDIGVPTAGLMPAAW